MGRLSQQEIVIGFLSTIIFINKLGWWLGLSLCFLTGSLWVLGGTYKKSIRRFGVPIAVLIYMNSLVALLGILPLLLGDGFPDYNPTTKDEGSWLGRLVEKVIGDTKYSGLITKLIPLALLQLIWLLVLFLK